MKCKVLLAFVALSIAGCFSHANIDRADVDVSNQTVWLAPYKVKCHDNVYDCFAVMSVANEGPDIWQPFVEDIIGFHYQQGLFYKLEISTHSEIDEKSKQIVVSHKLEQVLEKTTQHFLRSTMLTAKRQWRLKQLPSAPEIAISTLKKSPYLTLSNEGLVGFSGCNRMFGKQELLFESADYRQSKIKFGPVAMTRMACIEPMTNKVEHQVSLVINRVNRFAVQWPFLNLYHDDKLLAQFVAQDWD